MGKNKTKKTERTLDDRLYDRVQRSGRKLFFSVTVILDRTPSEKVARSTLFAAAAAIWRSSSYWDITKYCHIRQCRRARVRARRLRKSRAGTLTHLLKSVTIKISFVIFSIDQPQFSRSHLNIMLIRGVPDVRFKYLTKSIAARCYSAIRLGWEDSNIFTKETAYLTELSKIPSKCWLHIQLGSLVIPNSAVQRTIRPNTEYP